MIDYETFLKLAELVDGDIRKQGKEPQFTLTQAIKLLNSMHTDNRRLVDLDKALEFLQIDEEDYTYDREEYAYYKGYTDAVEGLQDERLRV